MLTSEYKIINTVLHELSHVLVDWRHTDPVLDEAEAEYFALSTMKEFYPKLYKKALNWTKRTIEDNTTDIVHKEGYIQTLQKLKELPKD
jgi:DNA repair ATPase RecN